MDNGSVVVLVQFQFRLPTLCRHNTLIFTFLPSSSSSLSFFSFSLYHAVCSRYHTSSLPSLLIFNISKIYIQFLFTKNICILITRNGWIPKTEIPKTRFRLYRLPITNCILFDSISSIILHSTGHRFSSYRQQTAKKSPYIKANQSVIFRVCGFAADRIHLGCSKKAWQRFICHFQSKQKMLSFAIPVSAELAHFYDFGGRSQKKINKFHIKILYYSIFMQMFFFFTLKTPLLDSCVSIYNFSNGNEKKQQRHKGRRRRR